MTYSELEKRLRGENIPVYCIAQEMEVPKTMALVNLQGKAGCEFVIGFFFSAKPKRAVFATGWPSSPEENIERLGNAGVPMESFIPLCRNCDGTSSPSQCSQPLLIPTQSLGISRKTVRKRRSKRKTRRPSSAQIATKRVTDCETALKNASAVVASRSTADDAVRVCCIPATVENEC